MHIKSEDRHCKVVGYVHLVLSADGKLINGHYEADNEEKELALRLAFKKFLNPISWFKRLF